MKTIFMMCICGLFISYNSNPKLSKLKVVFIRHGEKAAQGDNLTCQGLNRALQLPSVIVSQFGIPHYTYVPSLGKGENIAESRMFQTATPLAVKYNLTINSKYKKDDAMGIAHDIMQKKGTVLVVWEHNTIASIVEDLGIHDQDLKWSDDDFDSIWIVTFDKQGKASLTKSREGLTPSSNCSY
jgi:hypothetical protein